MKNMSPNKKDRVILIPYIEIITGTILLSLEVHDYMTLYSMDEADKLFDGLVDFYKYKESTYNQAFLWSILIFTGISYWVNKKLYWILTQTFLLLVLLKVLLPFYAIFIELNPIPFYIFPTLYIILFIWIETILCKIKQIESTPINSQTKLLGIATGLLCCIVYILLL